MTNSDEAGRRAPVQADRSRKGMPGAVAGTITWAEHEEAYAGYFKLYDTSQTAERLAERGGFGYRELLMFLGHEPRTWEPRT